MCNHIDLQKEVDNYYVDPHHKILQFAHKDVSSYAKNKIPYKIPINIDDIPCQCKKIKMPVAKKILHTAMNDQPIVVYNNCPKGLITAMYRQLRYTGDVNYLRVESYHQWVDKYFEKTIKTTLQGFKYSQYEWYNHLTSLSKQQEVDKFFDTIVSENVLTNNTYTLFGKREKQIISDKMPKYRAISACPPNVKYVMGPVIWGLERAFSEVHGYKINYKGKVAKNWEDIENIYAQRYKDGYVYTMDLDGSAWDTSVKYHMKYVVFKLYDYLCSENLIHHVDPSIFKRVSTQRMRRLVAKTYIDSKTYSLADVMIDSTTFSGSPDTTFSNTLIMSTLMQFVLQAAGYDEDDYCIDVSGDDTAIFLRHVVPTTEEAVKTIWSQLGLIPKFVKFGSYEDITFCSTSVIQEGQKFKIVRQVDRLNPLGHWSEKALSYSTRQLKTYYHDLYVSMNNWTNGMPYFQMYTDMYKIYSNMIADEPAEITNGKPKKCRPDPFNLYDPSNEKKYLNYGLEYAYSYEMRQSKTTISQDTVYQWLLNKYGITRGDVKDMEQNLLKPHVYNYTSGARHMDFIMTHDHIKQAVNL